MRIRLCICALLISTCSLWCLGMYAQKAGAVNPYTTELKVQYDDVRRNIIESAEKMPEDNYDFRPTQSVRTFRQLIGHLIDDQYAICALARGEPNPQGPAQKMERNGGSKAALVAGLRNSFEYCDALYGRLTDAIAAERVQSYDGTMQPRIQLLMIHTNHTNLHYGNMIVYLRVNGLVPPSTAQNK
jgi:uncharacterized damage-inducible protein DinB